MRIVLVISSLLTGGAETQVIAMSRELKRRGHVLVIYTLNKNNPRAWELEGSGVELVADQKCVKFDLAVLFRLRRFLKAFRADIVHGFLYDGDLYARVAAAASSVVALNSERNDGYRLNFAQRLGLWSTRQLAAGVVANSMAGARFAGQLYRFPQAKIHTVWNGIDLERIDERVRECRTNYKSELIFGINDVAPSFKLACLVGSIKPPKDYLLALNVAYELTHSHSNWRVLFLGDQLSNTGNYRGEVMNRYQQLGLEGKVFFGGSRSDVPEILSQCDVLFSTSLHEGFPNVVLEAMAVNTPVVSTNYSDIQAILPHPWQVVTDRQPRSMVSAILQASQASKKLVKEQRCWIENNATIAIAASKLEAVYRGYL